jgi:hypothetical protein
MPRQWSPGAKRLASSAQRDSSPGVLRFACRIELGRTGPHGKALVARWLDPAFSEWRHSSTTLARHLRKCKRQFTTDLGKPRPPKFSKVENSRLRKGLQRFPRRCLQAPCQGSGLLCCTFPQNLPTRSDCVPLPVVSDDHNKNISGERPLPRAAAAGSLPSRPPCTDIAGQPKACKQGDNWMVRRRMFL